MTTLRCSLRAPTPGPQHPSSTSGPPAPPPTSPWAQAAQSARRSAARGRGLAGARCCAWPTQGHPLPAGHGTGSPRRISHRRPSPLLAPSAPCPHPKHPSRFRLLNMRHDLRFALIRNGLQQPTVVAWSSAVRLARPNEPMQGHLALTGAPG